MASGKGNNNHAAETTRNSVTTLLVDSCLVLFDARTHETQLTVRQMDDLLHTLRMALAWIEETR